jgi:hypothetical protein
MKTTRCLKLGATPTFMALALLTGLAPSPFAMVCLSSASGLNDMTVMYLLMGVFHFPPWLTLLQSAPAQMKVREFFVNALRSHT